MSNLHVCSTAKYRQSKILLNSCVLFCTYFLPDSIGDQESNINYDNIFFHKYDSETNYNQL